MLSKGATHPWTIWLYWCALAIVLPVSGLQMFSVRVILAGGLRNVKQFLSKPLPRRRHRTKPCMMQTNLRVECALQKLAIRCTMHELFCRCWISTLLHCRSTPLAYAQNALSINEFNVRRWLPLFCIRIMQPVAPVNLCIAISGAAQHISASIPAHIYEV